MEICCVPKEDMVLHAAKLSKVAVIGSCDGQSSKPAHFDLQQRRPPTPRISTPIAVYESALSDFPLSRVSLNTAIMPDVIDPRMMSVQPRIRYNTIGGVNGPLVILDNVRSSALGKRCERGSRSWWIGQIPAIQRDCVLDTSRRHRALWPSS